MLSRNLCVCCIYTQAACSSSMQIQKAPAWPSTPHTHLGWQVYSVAWLVPERLLAPHCLLIVTFDLVIEF